MQKYVLIGRGFTNPTPELTQQWMDWFDRIKGSIVDGGNPFGPGREVTRDGVQDLPMGAESLNGYVIINAADIDEAEKIASDSPYVTSMLVYPAMSM